MYVTALTFRKKFRNPVEMRKEFCICFGFWCLPEMKLRYLRWKRPQIYLGFTLRCESWRASCLTRAALRSGRRGHGSYTGAPNKAAGDTLVHTKKGLACEALGVGFVSPAEFAVFRAMITTAGWPCWRSRLWSAPGGPESRSACRMPARYGVSHCPARPP